jgi:hypothetical protein
MEPTDTDRVKRRTAFLIVLSCLVLPASAMAGLATVGDGTLSIRNGDGQMRLTLDRGVAIGRIGSGSLTVVDPKNDDCYALLVWDDGERAEPVPVVVEKALELREFRCVFKGTNMRFRLGGLEGSNFRIVGTEIGLSAVGTGIGRIKGRLLDPVDGTYAVNGEEYASLPDDWKVFQLAAPNSVD